MKSLALDTAQQTLFDCHADWARRQGRFNRRVSWLGRDAAEQAALIGLIRAARTWNPERTTFRSWAKRCILSVLCDGCRELLPRKQVRNGVTMVPLTPVQFRLPGRGPAVGHEADQRDRVAVLLRGLNARERYVVTRIYVDGARQKDVARELGTCESRVSQILRRAMWWLRQGRTRAVS